jgi:uncharacterized protein YwqG
LSFLAQLDLAELRAAGGIDWLPDHGRLLFFYELAYGGWGFDPKDAGSAVVRYEIGMAAPATEPADLSADMRFDESPVTFASDVSCPSGERLDVDWEALSGPEERALEDAFEALQPSEPAHQVGGYPTPIQNDLMELECQLATNGLYVGGSKGYEGHRVEELKPGASDWRLLLQLDTDPKVGFVWGDSGRLYFWIREQDARAGDFSKAWAILQCY